ncbi:MAG: acyloxyacyl hydrolase [Alphaproteobacteria bacterium]|nr:acyloxyacyl hydrolase [Alphaproteobacteria bacterium]MBV9371604.1 acyloxyacyl hydrolase [Alphaproteobacteria bacterium]MBV9902213.1 acyloxyacyl hydrolase [Alphaproteobacteria bacterium]
MKLRHALAAAAALAASPAAAQEIFGGVYDHDTNIITASGLESGADVEIGWRGGPILPALGGPRPHAFVSVNSAGDTHFAAVGVSWRIGHPVYVRPGIGIAVHTGHIDYDPSSGRIGLGSRVLFEPEIGLGYRLSDRVSIEASWVHLSHATLFGSNNPGLDTVGLRLNYKLR